MLNLRLSRSLREGISGRWSKVSTISLALAVCCQGMAKASPFLDDDLSDIAWVGYIGDVFHQGFWTDTIGEGLGGSNGYSTQPLYFYLPDGAQADHGSYTSAFGISGDGGTIVGASHTASGLRPFYWTQATGFTALDIGSSATSAMATEVSTDGSSISGFAMVSGVEQAFYWQLGDSEIRLLGTLGGAYSYTNAISGDGTTVVGQSTTLSVTVTTHGFVWQSATGMIDVGVLDGGAISYATHVSNDGAAVGVLSETGSGWHAARWTEAGLEDLGTLGGTYSELRAMDDDGNVIVGISSTDAGINQAFRWTAGTSSDSGTMVSLHSSAFIASDANDVSSDGSVVVGTASLTEASSGPGSPAAETRGFRWTEATGMISVDDWLRANGVRLQQDMTKTADLVSADGTRVFGGNLEGGYYLAQVNGVITIEDYVTSAAQTNSVAIGLQTSSASTIMFGAQGSPMRNLLEVGRRSAWGTVDAGYDSGTKSEGGLVLGDFGFGYGLMDGVTVRLQGGATHTDQDLYDSGDFQARSWYVAPEVTAQLLGDFYLTVGGLYGRGDLDINRGYQNGTALDFSTGKTDTETLAGKVRIDWLNAVTLGDAAFTPYFALSRTLAKTDAYVETGGSFPATHDAASEHATIARLGVDGVYKLNDTVSLLARAEAAYRFEDKTNGTSTEVAGVQLSVAGDDIKQFWLRGGIGTEIAVGGGVASFMLNATTESEDPDVWLRSGWKVDF